jgi:hypothetical protein
MIADLDNGEIRAVNYNSVYNIFLYILHDIATCFDFLKNHLSEM